MVYSNSTVSFEKMLMKFMSEADPMLSMLKWLCAIRSQLFLCNAKETSCPQLQYAAGDWSIFCPLSHRCFVKSLCWRPKRSYLR
jgi:hypothetical protein